MAPTHAGRRPSRGSPDRSPQSPSACRSAASGPAAARAPRAVGPVSATKPTPLRRETQNCRLGSKKSATIEHGNSGHREAVFGGQGGLVRCRHAWKDPEELRIEGIGRLKLRAARKFRGPVYASERLNGSPLKASLCWPTVSIAQNKKPAAPPAKSPRKRQNRDDMSKPPLRSGRPHVACEAGNSVDPRKFHTPRKFRKLSGPPAGRASKGS